MNTWYWVGSICDLVRLHVYCRKLTTFLNINTMAHKMSVPSNWRSVSACKSRQNQTCSALVNHSFPAGILAWLSNQTALTLLIWTWQAQMLSLAGSTCFFFRRDRTFTIVAFAEPDMSLGTNSFRAFSRSSAVCGCNSSWSSNWQQHAGCSPTDSR